MEPAYRYDFISGLEGLLIEGEHGWPELCAELGVAPLEIAYEDLVDASTYAGVIRSALGYLYIHDNEIAIPRPRTNQQADEINDDWVHQYLTDRAKLERPDPDAM